LRTQDQAKCQVAEIKLDRKRNVNSKGRGTELFLRRGAIEKEGRAGKQNLSGQRNERNAAGVSIVLAKKTAI